MSTYLEELVQDWWSKSEDMPSAPSNVYVSLHTADEGNQPDGSNEIDSSSASYSRVSTSPADWNVSGSGPTTVSNANAINFGDPTESWGTVSHFAIWDASTAGNPLLATVALDSSKSIDSSTDEVRFDSGALTADLD